MFHTIRPEMLARMRYLEKIDTRDRDDQTPQRKRLRQIPAETGRFLAILAASAPAGRVIEIGTSGGYSAMWLSLGCEEDGHRITTYEVDQDKAGLAQETFRDSGLDGKVELVVGDAREHLPELSEIAFCFLDAEKDIYAECYELVIPRMIRGGILAADNVISHREQLHRFVEQVENDPRADSVVVPIGQGVLVCRVVR